jgi:RNA polymerase sigma-70 factor, ECF subfamily
MDLSTELTQAQVAAAQERTGRIARRALSARIEATYRAEGTRFRRLAAAVAGPDMASDVVQDAFARALRTSASWRADGPLEAWLWQLVLNEARDAERRRRRRERLNGRLARAFERGTAAPAVVDDTLLGPLRRLPVRQRDCIVLRYYGDLSYEQLAAVMGIEPGTVGALLSKAHKALRAELEKGDHE